MSVVQALKALLALERGQRSKAHITHYGSSRYTDNLSANTFLVACTDSGEPGQMQADD